MNLKSSGFRDIVKVVQSPVEKIRFFQLFHSDTEEWSFFPKISEVMSDTISEVMSDTIGKNRVFRTVP